MNKASKIINCCWRATFSFEDTYYETDCGETIIFEDGGPKENHYRFCPFCGTEIVEPDELTGTDESGGEK